MRFVMGAGRSRLLLIPRGVAHGAANPWTEVAPMFYFVNQQFSLSEPDERRLPWDAFGADFWEMVRG
jgi:dTDP-4-dehydrorhamnose 3,5-epimerase-like enzyme